MLRQVAIIEGENGRFGLVIEDGSGNEGAIRSSYGDFDMAYLTAKQLIQDRRAVGAVVINRTTSVTNEAAEAMGCRLNVSLWPID